MANLVIKPANELHGEIHIPGDKSISHRAVMLGSIANGITTINNFLPSVDCLATVDCFRKLGVNIQMSNVECRMSNDCKIIIKGKGLFGLKKSKKDLYVGNSGTTIRLIIGILAGQKFETKISGDESIQRRPMGRVVKPLMEMGAAVEGIRMRDKNEETGEIFAPLKIIGVKLKGITYKLPVASAQVKSAVLLAGLLAEGTTTVIEKVQARDHTERMLEHFEADIHINGLESRVTGRKEFEGMEIDVPGDLSSAAFFLIAGIIAPNSEITLLNVGVNPTRTGIIDVLHRMGAEIEIQNERILSQEPRADILVRSSSLKGIVLDGEIIPRIIDEIPILAVAATQATGITEIRGAKELRIKESDRIATIVSELRKFEAKIEELPEGLRIEGPVKLKGAAVKSYGDHRIAMAMAIAGLIAEGQTLIEDTACIETSFPGFEKIMYDLRT